MNKTISNILLYMILLLALICSITSVCIAYMLGLGPLENDTTIVIERGISTKAIAQKLYDNKIIGNRYLFRLASKVYTIVCSVNLKSGEYSFKSNISALQVLRILSSGKSILHNISIIPGWSVNQAINVIKQESRLIGNIDENIAEGLLLPNSYYFSYGDSKELLIHKIKDSMQNILNQLMKELDPNSIIKTQNELLILASIVEKEGQAIEEFPIIASVFLNRLRKGMKLQADPTVIYAITNGQFQLQRPLTKKDLKIKSPYNTYDVFGLPKTPICCPSIDAIKSVVRPAKTDALYFVVDADSCKLYGKCKHKFSNSLVEHNKNVAQYKNSQK